MLHRLPVSRSARTLCQPRTLRQYAARPSAAACDASRCLVACAAALVSDSKAESSSTLSLSVYIEDTDHYQVAFYANYLKWFLRAREAALGTGMLTRLKEDQLRPAVLCVDKAKYTSAARLGDAVDIVSVVSRHTAKSLRWQQSAVRANSPSAKPFVAADIVVGFLRPDDSLADVPDYLLAAAWPAAGPERAGGAWAALAPYKELKTVSVTDVRVYSDEVSSWGSADEVSLLRWFERNRTDSIGGAAGLRALETSGYLVVVTGVNDLRLDPAARIVPGDLLSVRSGVELRMKNQFIIFKQELWRGPQLLAQGEVACASIDSSTMKLAGCPPDLVQRFLTPSLAAIAAA